MKHRFKIVWQYCNSDKPHISYIETTDKCALSALRKFAKYFFRIHVSDIDFDVLHVNYVGEALNNIL